jgi:hypothetical protein
MNKRFLVPAVGLVLLGGSALALADGGWRHDGRLEHGPFHDFDRGWHGRGWGHVPPPHWRGPVSYGPPPVYGPRWYPPRRFDPWGPRPYAHRGAWERGGWNRDGVTIILRSGFH